MRLSPPRAWPRSAWLLLAANLVPLAGVLLLGWELGAIMLLFWLENAVIGVYHILRMALVAGAAAFALVPFFTVHYGVFTAVHGMFVVFLFAPDPDWRILAPGILALVLSHGASFVMNFLRGGEMERARERMRAEQAPPRLTDEAWAQEALAGAAPRAMRMTTAGTALMAAPYKRVVVLHLTIIGGGFLMLELGSPTYALALLVALKTGIDLVAHVAEHRDPGQSGKAASAASGPHG